MKKYIFLALAFVIICTVTSVYATNDWVRIRPLGAGHNLGQVLGETTSSAQYKTTDMVNVRTLPSVGKASSIIAKQQIASIGTVVPGSTAVVADGYTWIQLVFSPVVTGWVAADNLLLMDTGNTTDEVSSTNIFDEYIKSIPQQIETLQQIQKNPDSIKDQYLTFGRYLQTSQGQSSIAKGGGSFSVCTVTYNHPQHQGQPWYVQWQGYQTYSTGTPVWNYNIVNQGSTQSICKVSGLINWDLVILGIGNV